MIKKLLLILCFLLIPHLSFPWTLPIYEDCESGTYPGYDWGASEYEVGTGTAAEYTGSNKNGNAAVQFSTGSGTGGNWGTVYLTGTGESTLWLISSLWIDSELMETTNYTWFFHWRAASSVAGAQILDDAGTLKLRASHGTITGTGTTGLSLDTEYIVKGKYVAGSGANGILEIYLKTPGQKYGSPQINIQTGDATDSVTQVRFGVYASSGDDDTTIIQMDDYYISTTDPDPDPSGQIIMIGCL